MQFVAAKDVKEGMYVAADVRDEHGRTLIGRGQCIGVHHIVRLRKFHIESIFIDPAHGASVERPTKSEIRDQCVQILSSTVGNVSKEMGAKKLAIDPASINSVADKLIDALANSKNPLVVLLDVSTAGDSQFQHAVNTAVLASALAIDLHVPEAMLKDLAIAMLFHDIGNIFLPDELVQKHGIPNHAEASSLRRHPLLGFEHLVRADAISSVAANVILRHHEHLDGSGYPGSVNGEKLSILMKIAAVCEVYDSLTAPQFGMPPAMPDAAVSYLLSNAGKLYAKEVVGALCRRVALYPVGSAVQLSSGECGVVAGVLPGMPTRPVVLVHVDSRGYKLRDPMIVDLNKESARSVVRSASNFEALLTMKQANAPARPVHPVLATLG